MKYNDSLHHFHCFEKTLFHEPASKRIATANKLCFRHFNFTKTNITRLECETSDTFEDIQLVVSTHPNWIISPKKQGENKTCLKPPPRYGWNWNSKNSGFSPKSSILIGISIIFTIHFGGTPIFGNTHMGEITPFISIYNDRLETPSL